MARSMTGTRTPLPGPAPGLGGPGGGAGGLAGLWQRGGGPHCAAGHGAAAPAGAGSCPHLFGIRGCGGSGGGKTRRFFLEEARGYRVTADYAGAVQPGDDLVFLCNPNNPTGSLAEPGAVAALLEACSRVGAVLVVDECFLPFTDAPSCKGLLARYPNLIVLGPLPSCMPWRGFGWGICCVPTGIWPGALPPGASAGASPPQPRRRGWRRWACPIGRRGPGSTFARSAPGWRTGSERWAFRCTLRTAPF